MRAYFTLMFSVLVFVSFIIAMLAVHERNMASEAARRQHLVDLQQDVSNGPH